MENDKLADSIKTTKEEKFSVRKILSPSNLDFSNSGKSTDSKVQEKRA